MKSVVVAMHVYQGLPAMSFETLCNLSGRVHGTMRLVLELWERRCPRRLRGNAEGKPGEQAPLENPLARAVVPASRLRASGARSLIRRASLSEKRSGEAQKRARLMKD